MSLSVPPTSPSDRVLAHHPSQPSSPCSHENSLSQSRPAIDEEIIQLSPWRRWAVLFTVCWMPVPMTFSIASVLAAGPEVAADFNVPSTSISIANAGVFAAMATSPLIWFPMVNLVGRRTAYLAAACLLGACSIGEALAPNMAVYVAIWVVGGTTGVVFLVSGQTILSDIFEPTTRGTAVGLLLGSTVSAQTIAPLTGGILATYTSWRVIYGLQAGMTVFGAAMAFFFIPPDIPQPSTDRPTALFQRVLKAFSPAPVFKVLAYQNILLSNISCGLLSFNLYGLLSAIRYSLSDGLGLTSSRSSGLFYLAPGSGFVLGSTVGGVLSDRKVKEYIRKRHGLRLPRDRLRSGMFAALIILPAGTLLFGWSLQCGVGGVALPAAGAFLAGVGLMAAFNGLNTYASEVLPNKKVEVISCKYVIQYSGSAATVASRMPILEAVGVGWAFTITAVFAIVSGLIVQRIIVYEPRTEKGSERS